MQHYPECAAEASTLQRVKAKLDKLLIYSVSLRKHSHQEGPSMHHLQHHSIYPMIFQLKYLLSSNLTISEQPTRFLLRITIRKKGCMLSSLPQLPLHFVSVK